MAIRSTKQSTQASGVAVRYRPITHFQAMFGEAGGVYSSWSIWAVGGVPNCSNIVGPDGRTAATLIMFKKSNGFFRAMLRDIHHFPFILLPGAGAPGQDSPEPFKPRHVPTESGPISDQHHAPGFWDSRHLFRADISLAEERTTESSLNCGLYIMLSRNLWMVRGIR